MADSDSLESSMSGAEFDARVRCVGKDMANRFSSDKQTPNKSKFSSSGADAPEIGASYIVRRHDDARRKLLTFGKMRACGCWPKCRLGLSVSTGDPNPKINRKH